MQKTLLILVVVGCFGFVTPTLLGGEAEPGAFRPAPPSGQPGPPPEGVLPGGGLPPRGGRQWRGPAPTDPNTGLPLRPELSDYPRFDLDFRGGRPAELVSAIEKAMGNSLNAIIPDDLANVLLPPLKMRDVTVPQLLGAVSAATEKTTTNGQTVSYGFKSLSPQGNVRDTIWSFFRVSSNPGPFSGGVTLYGQPHLYGQPQPPPPRIDPKPVLICRVYQLGPYLETYKVEDITTAVQTSWKMLGDPSPPTLNFHKDTKLL